MSVDPDSLPAPVQRFVERVLPAGTGHATAVRIDQLGEMTLKPGARPRAFRATEELSCDRVGFAWWASFPMFGRLGLRVTDSYLGGEGMLEVRLLGLPLQRRRGPELARGEAYRYLAEIPWVPHAILSNSELEWDARNEHAVEVATRVGEARIAVELQFNEENEIVGTAAPRPRAEAGNAITPWTGEFAGYRAFGEVVVPAHGEVRWETPDGPFTYWRGTVTALEVRRGGAVSGRSPEGS